MKSLTEDERNRLMDEARKGDSIDRLVVIFSGYLGMRAEEIHYLNENWFSWQREEINIPEEDGEWPKKGKARARTVDYGHLDERLKDYLSHYYRDHDSLDAYKATMYKRVEKLAEKAGIKTKVTLKTLRNTAAECRCEQINGNVSRLAEEMGFTVQTAAKYCK